MQTSNNSRANTVLKWSLVVGIVIVLNLFYNYSLSLVFSEPDYNTYCPQKQMMLAPENPEQCLDSGGSWTEYPKPVKSGEATGYCDQTFTCNQKYEEASKIYDRNVFIVLVILGVITFVLSLVFVKLEILSVALSVGAVLDFVIASIRYWRYADNLIKVFILGVALAVLVWVAVKKVNIKSENEVGA